MKPLVVLVLAATLPSWGAAQTASDPAATKSSSGSQIRINLDQKPTTAPGAKAPAAPATAKATGTTKAAGTVTTKATSTAKGTTDKTAKKDAKGAKKEEPPAKIDGQEIGRGAKGFLGLQVADGTFKLGFYDAKKKPIAPDVVRAALRWQPTYQRAPELHVLGPGDGKSLSGAKPVRPPYSFKLFMSLFAEGSDEPVESYVIDFRQ